MAKTEKKGEEKKLSKKWKKYKVSGDTIERIGKICPKCGSGVFMAEHKNRRSCGKCGYMEKIQ